jgi:DNA methylase
MTEFRTRLPTLTRNTAIAPYSFHPSASLPSDADFLDLIAAARDTSYVTGLTHNFYKYPARFSPKFVKTAIKIFSEPGDLICDPFMGGGTTLVEALALGRHAIGTDISSLATFVTEVKTTLFNDRELELLERWVRRLPQRVDMHGQAIHFGNYAEGGYYRHLDSVKTWRLRKAIEQALASAMRLGLPKLEAFARCVVLRTAQWALDARKNLPTIAEFRERLTAFACEMLTGARELRAAVEAQQRPERPQISCLNLSAAHIARSSAIRLGHKPKLVLTSPPYPGIHVLYHRWQVDGRKETPAPFWIANKLDGAGSAYYTMGDRKAVDLATYFTQLQPALAGIAQCCDETTTIIQVVAFAEPAWQLPRYLDINDAVGFKEMRIPGLVCERDGRLWRTVPNRKWHADQLGSTPASNEAVLFFRRER